MIRFLDGPAAGVGLLLRRAPVFLHAVQDAEGKWDALDQLDDRPSPGETVYAYRQSSHTGYIHINTGRREGHGFYRVATYRLCPDQPDGMTMHDTALWRGWCLAHRNDPIPTGSKPAITETSS